MVVIGNESGGHGYQRFEKIYIFKTNSRGLSCQKSNTLTNTGTFKERDNETDKEGKIQRMREYKPEILAL